MYVTYTYTYVCTYICMYVYLIHNCVVSYVHTYCKVKEEADKVPKLQGQTQELSTQITQLQDEKKSLDKLLEKSKSELEEQKKEITELQEKSKVC